MYPPLDMTKYEKYKTCDGFWVVAIPAGELSPAVGDLTGACYEARPKGGIKFQYLQGSITFGALSLILFEGADGGHIMSDALIEILV